MQGYKLLSNEVKKQVTVGWKTSAARSQHYYCFDPTALMMELYAATGKGTSDGTSSGAMDIFKKSQVWFLARQ